MSCSCSFSKATTQENLDDQKSSRVRRARYLGDDEAIVAFLNSSLEIDDPAHLVSAIGAVAKAKGISSIAEQNAVSQSHSDSFDTRIGNVGKVLDALDLAIEYKTKSGT